MTYEGSKAKDRREEFADLCGVWTAEEATQFLESISDFETVEPDGNAPR